RRLFRIPPHKWFIRQRLMRARLLLISTSLSISQIGTQCTFPNTSHFIKLFKKEYALTPATYRTRHLATDVSQGGLQQQSLPARELPMYQSLS
ncbi:MAG: helix-turn-helix domain-containing protein, partial [Alistipes sp.]